MIVPNLRTKHLGVTCGCSTICTVVFLFVYSASFITRTKTLQILVSAILAQSLKKKVKANSSCNFYVYQLEKHYPLSKLL